MPQNAVPRSTTDPGSGTRVVIRKISLNALSVPFDLYEPGGIRNNIQYAKNSAGRYPKRNWPGEP